CMQGLDFPWTF
nr:immunoglobulin light chain junction region [Macaca mulatta]MOV35200.1 immunoglobulin light chain junction region [Macaca mulatta]MOV35313.1 immunoglobulin light chain junction region [Macaca mulatta]MOW09275.1 immunoglobulin light chain junction region [Macaca mulatta]MOX51841.1 immunoglobulin light chain junction region [Macaca mulatta]